jgi:hypothetical protein
MDWRTCSPGEVGAEAAQSLDGRGRGQYGSGTHRLDPSQAPHVTLWAPRGLENPRAGRLGEGASRGER